jgi:hypothetical protein
MIIETKRIETMDNWHLWEQAIRDKSYSIWYMQYDWFEPEGFNMAFQKDGTKGLVLITHN